MLSVLSYAAALGYQHVKGRCLVFGVLLAGDGAAADCQIYDSDGQLFNQRMHIEAASGGSQFWFSPQGVMFEFGVYVVSNAVTSKVTVEWAPSAPNP